MVRLPLFTGHWPVHVCEGGSYLLGQLSSSPTPGQLRPGGRSAHPDPSLLVFGKVWRAHLPRQDVTPTQGIWEGGLASQGGGPGCI